MRSSLRFILVALACIAIAGGVRTGSREMTSREIAAGRSACPGEYAGSAHGTLPPPYPSPALTTFPDPTAPPGSSARVFVDPQAFDSLILAATAQFTDKVRDEGSLREYREAIAHRAERAKAQLRERIELAPSRPVAVAGSGVAGPLDLPAARVRRPLRGGP